MKRRRDEDDDIVEYKLYDIYLEKIDLIKYTPSINGTSREWLKRRQNMLTSSDAATALGLNPFKPSYMLLFEKCGLVSPFTGNDATQYGQLMESRAIDAYCLKTGYKHLDIGLLDIPDSRLLPKIEPAFAYDVFNGTYDFIGGTPDGIVIPRYVGDIKTLCVKMIEVKCPHKKRVKWRKVPPHYMPQIQLNMLLTRISTTDFIQYFPPEGDKPEMLNIIHVNRDDDLIMEYLSQLHTFWEEVKYWRNNDIASHPEYDKIRSDFI